MTDEHKLIPPLRMETPVFIVGPSTRVEVLETVPGGQVYLIDGETYCVNGEYPFSKNKEGLPGDLPQSEETEGDQLDKA